MAGVNNYFPFAVDPSAALISQAVWESGILRPVGHVPNSIANPALENKALRQATTMSAALGILIASVGKDALDDGTPENLAASLTSMITQIGGGTESSGVYRNSGYVVDSVPNTSQFNIAADVAEVSTFFEVNDWIMISSKEMQITEIDGDTTTTTVTIAQTNLDTTVDVGQNILISFLELNGVEKIINKNVAFGYAGLDANAKIVPANLPDATETTIGAVRFATDAEASAGADVPAVLTPKQVVEVATNNETIYDLILTNWSRISLERGTGLDPGFSGVTYSAYLDLFVGVFESGSNSNSIWTSKDGETWVPRSHPGTNLEWGDIAWSDQLQCFVVIGGAKGTSSSTNILSSVDGINWFSRVSPVNDRLQKLNIRSDGAFMCYTYAGDKFIVSLDGINFTSTNVTGSSTISMQGYFAYSKQLNVWVAPYGNNIGISRSINGYSFSQVSQNLNISTIWGIGRSDEIGLFFGVFVDTDNINWIWYSQNGLTWTRTNYGSGLSRTGGSAYLSNLGCFVFIEEWDGNLSGGYVQSIDITKDGKNWKTTAGDSRSFPNQKGTSVYNKAASNTICQGKNTIVSVNGGFGSLSKTIFF